MNGWRWLVVAVAALLLGATFLFPYTSYYVVKSEGSGGDTFSASFYPRKAFVPVWRKGNDYWESERSYVSAKNVLWKYVLAQAGGIAVAGLIAVLCVPAGKRERPTKNATDG